MDGAVWVARRTFTAAVFTTSQASVAWTCRSRRMSPPSGMP
jgi:hypothetical protein